ncbi:MAG: hypothetical protein HKO81_10065, partial [Flavobacteriaceae bacterium]|nr:hypothetical protein [Flavobacteriaceae bacterium]
YSLLGFDSEIVKTLTGDWTSEQVPELIVTVYIEDNRLLYKNNTNSDIGEFYFLSESQYITSDELFHTIVKEENESTIKSNTGVVWKKRKG